MNKRTIESGTNQPTFSAAGQAESTADNAVLKSEPQASDPDTLRDVDVDPLDSRAAPEKDKKLSIETGSDPIECSLHAATLWLPCLEMFLGILIPVFLTSIFVPFGSVVFFVVCFGLLPTVAFHTVRYITFRYRVTGNELVLNSGLVFRRERRIPFDRIQEMAIHQGVIHRILDLAKLEITTAGSDAQEAYLNVLSRQSAEAVKETISGFRPTAAAETDRQIGGMEAAPDYVCQLTTRDLVLGGLTSRLVASLGAVITAIVYFQLFVGMGGRWVGQEIDHRAGRRWPGEGPFDKLTERLESWMPDLGPFNFVVDFFFNDTLPKSVSLALLGLVGSVVAYVIRYHGFRLIRSGDLLTTSHGLLTFRRGSLQRDRIQALKLEEGLLRRYFGLASIRVDSAGDRDRIDEAQKRDVLLPVAPKNTAQEIARQAIPGLTELEPTWRRVSRRAVRRGCKKGWLLILLAMLQTYGVADWFCLIWLPTFPLVYFLNYQWYRHMGYWLEGNHILTRKGWLNRETVCLPIKNIQNVSVTQSFFDRRLNLATLSIDTAGQSNTGGGPVIRNLPVDEARTLQQTLVGRVADCEFAW